ncbi:MAG TPA: hypothetical protein VIK41_13060, partial [Gemmatimonadaceae bacterium]
MLTTRVLCAAFVMAAGLAAPISASGQSLGSLKKKAEEEAKKAKAAVDKKPTVDTTTKKPAAAPASASQETPAATSAAPAPAAAGSSDAAAAKPNAKIWENYDFVPGNKVIFYTDFSEDKVGNFARGVKYRGGSAEIVERNDTKVLRATSTAEFLVPVGKKLPERFTLEVDVIAPLSGVMNRALSFEGGAEQAGDEKSAWVTWNPQGAWIQGSGLDMNSGGAHVPEAMASAFAGNVTHIRVLMDGAYFKMYANERRL